MLWMGMLTLHAGYETSATALALYALRRVPRRAIALLRMTILLDVAPTLPSGCHSAGLIWIRRGPGADTFRRRGSRVCRLYSNQRFLPATRLAWCYSSRL